MNLVVKYPQSENRDLYRPKYVDTDDNGRTLLQSPAGFRLKTDAVALITNFEQHLIKQRDDGIRKDVPIERVVYKLSKPKFVGAMVFGAAVLGAALAVLSSIGPGV